jgi:hypothetical protein
MNARWLPLLTICLSLGLQSISRAAELPDYLRYAEDGQSARLEVAIRSFTMPSGQKVDLIGAVHIADDAYYQELNKRFNNYDTVLFELVGDPEWLQKMAPLTQAERELQSGRGTISTIQLTAAKYLNLTFQLGAIDYRGKNMVHADFSAEEFEKMQLERGETAATLFVRAMKAQLNGELNSSAADELDIFGLLRILVSEDSATEFKKALAKNFDQMESMTAAMEGNEGSVVLSGRNAVVGKKIGEVLANRKQRRIAVFFGGAHMPGIETLLTRDLKAKTSGEEWLPAWTMPKVKKPRADTNPARETATPAS